MLVLIYFYLLYIKFISNSYVSLCFLAITCRINPVTNNNKAITKIIFATIKVGNLGTSPVFIYSEKIGTCNVKDITNNTNAIILKNIACLYYLNNIAIVFNTLKPSE